MSSAAIATIVKMIEDLPESAQQQVVEHLREYLEDLGDEMRWDLTFERTQDKLVEAARRAKDYNATGQRTCEEMQLFLPDGYSKGEVGL